jgi:hypothetical protein
MSSQQSPRRGTIEITLFGFLVSLTLKGALDTAYGHSIPTVTSARDLLHAVCVPASLLVIVFLLTLLRFVYGAYRFHEECQDSSTTLKPWAQLWNIAATLVLFVFFYLTGLSIQHAQPFYIGLIAVHLWDFIWFASIVVWTDNLTDILRKTMTKFIIIDVVTIGLLALTLFFTNKYRGKAAVMMFVLAIIDFAWNRKFFFHPAEWRASQQ